VSIFSSHLIVAANSGLLAATMHWPLIMWPLMIKFLVVKVDAAPLNKLVK
jgi:hypothetical protein